LDIADAFYVVHPWIMWFFILWQATRNLTKDLETVCFAFGLNFS